MAEIIYSKYSNERSRRFAIRTDILEENKSAGCRKKLFTRKEKSIWTIWLPGTAD